MAELLALPEQIEHTPAVDQLDTPRRTIRTWGILGSPWREITSPAANRSTSTRAASRCKARSSIPANGS